MRNFLIVLFSVLLTIPNFLFCQNKKDTLPAFIGISYIPSLKWKVFNVTKADGNFLSYKFDINAQSSFEGNFAIRPIGIRLGLSANVDNNMVGKAYKWGGYIGFRNVWIKLQRTQISGSVHWSGATPPGFSRDFKFSNDYFTIDLIKASNAYKHMAGGASANKILGTYWGIGYTSMAFPLKISTLKTPGGREHQKFGIPAYDTLFKAKYYTASFGFDILRQICLTSGNSGIIPGKPAAKFGIYASTQDKIGLGPGEHSKHAIRMAEALNPGLKFVKPRGISALVNYNLSVGFRYTVKLKPVFMIFAMGYDFEGAAITNFGGAADTNKDLGYESNFFYLDHGVSFKFYLSWIGNK